MNLRNLIIKSININKNSTRSFAIINHTAQHRYHDDLNTWDTNSMAFDDGAEVKKVQDGFMGDRWSINNDSSFDSMIDVTMKRMLLADYIHFIREVMWWGLWPLSQMG